MLLVILLFLIYSISSYIDVSQFGIYTGCPWYNFITYSFIHTNIFHLLTNSALFLFYWRRIRQMNKYIVFTIVVSVTILSSILSVYPQSTIGLSASIISMAGIITSTLHRRKQIEVIILFSVSCTITIFASNINTLIHIYSFTFSLIMSLVVKRYLYDCNRNHTRK